jgi:hypothetical protein
VADYLISREADVAIVEGVVGTVTVPVNNDIIEVGILRRGMERVRSTPKHSAVVRYILGEIDGAGYVDMYVEDTVEPPFVDEDDVTMTVQLDGDGTTQSMSGTVKLFNMRHVPLGPGATPGKQRVRYDWVGALQ